MQTDANSRFSECRESALKCFQICAFQFLTIMEIMATSDVIASFMPFSVFFFPSPLSSMIILPLHLTFSCLQFKQRL